MTIDRSLTKHFAAAILMVGAGCTGVLGFSSAVHASTFAISQSSFEFLNFSHQPFDAGTSAETDTLTVSFDGSVTAEAQANSVFPTLSSEPVSAANFVSTLTAGTGTDYLGSATGLASLVGTFEIGRNQSFSFDFSGSLSLAGGIERPLFERARAGGGIGFDVFHQGDGEPTGGNIDSFSAAGELNTRGSNRYDFFATDHISLTDVAVVRTPDGSQEAIQLNFQGSFNRLFQKGGTVQLSEGKFGAAEVTSSPTPIPEPLTVLGSVLAVGMGGLLRRQYLQNS